MYIEHCPDHAAEADVTATGYFESINRVHLGEISVLNTVFIFFFRNLEKEIIIRMLLKDARQY
tara:strand:+ start:1500 stop:1688 length:189 start_codon:yes stop_codon:yes gene_type:complete